jgi:carbon monoxide dehydrogenase subunit G
MPSFTHSIQVDVDPDTAWQVLGDLAAVDRWIPGITQVELDGMTRVCTFADGHTQHEAILDYTPATRSYRYTIDGGLPVADNQGRFAVEPTPRGATIVWESSFRALDPAAEAEVSRLWAGMLPIVLGNLKTLIEQRRPDLPASGCQVAAPGL